MSRTRFPIRYTPVKGLVLRLIGAPQRWAYVEIKGDRIRVRMSWAFSARFSRSKVAYVSREKDVLFTAGVHGWRGRWLVNGASGPIVAIKLLKPVRARVILFPVRLSELQVSVANPDALIDQVRH
jgi:hypothetical protein